MSSVTQPTPDPETTMAAKELKKLTAASDLTAEITAAIKKAGENMSTESIVAILDQIKTLIEED
jgi:hypothetical protein